MVKNLPPIRETCVQPLGWKDPLEKGMATHSSIPAWRIPWTEEPGWLQSMGSQGKERGLNARQEDGEAAFYGPKLDCMVKDAIGRRWQLGTIQVDYNLPVRFDLEYTAEDNSKQRPVMIHRAPFGSMERFVAVLIEHTAGHFPLWLTPE